MAFPDSALFCLQRTAFGSAGKARPLPRLGDEDGGRLLACAVCRQPITSNAAGIEIDGRHEHSCVNPHGLRFMIGCFVRAQGLVPSGERSTFWSWFPGHSWQVEQCGGCGEHLGWIFRSAGSHFHGLILDRLVEVEEET
jgi:hypothetical protein